ncbi:MAG: cobalt ECF transporter T component CbiQ [Methanomicrobiales archaeon]|nr:cobalt ECF transporter T component CbiQ [Methanomicrobiales archaeon]
MENILDDFAHQNALRHVDARLKLVLGIGAIIISVSSASPAAPLCIAATMACITIILAKIPAGLYLRLLAIPFGFAATSGIVLVLLTGGGAHLWEATVLGCSLSVTAASVNLGLLAVARTFGGMCSLYFIALTTPMVSLFAVMQTLRLPREFIDLSMLVYRFIFVLIGEAIAIQNAQEMRHGYTGFKRSVRSCSMLGAMLFIRSWEKGEDLLRAMDSRCYDGRLELPRTDTRLSLRGAACVAAYLAACTLILIVTADIQVI